MERAVPRHVAIWIDPHQAVLLSSESEPCDRSALPRPDEGWSQNRVRAERYLLRQQYYDAVLSHLEPLDEILILGPGRTKLELRRQIEKQEGLKGKVVGLYHASTLAEVEVIFPTSETWHAEQANEAEVDMPIPWPALGPAERMRVQR
jgi:hypothetical protein